MVCYGKGIASLAEDIGKTVEEAQVVYDKIMSCFPGLLRLMEESQQCAREKGYVETVWGRRRHLPDMQLPKYTISCKDNIYFDPFFDSEKLGVVSKLEARKQYWISQLDSCKYSGQKLKVRERAAKEGFTIKDNGRFISQATRQCVNSRVQGSAADQTKIACNLIGRDKLLKENDFKILLLVHDEIIGECPAVIAKVCAKRLSELMIQAAKDICVPSKCDVAISECWYGDEIDINTL